jgi:glycosyltransferase involved in cell wall biosynthesis
MISLVTTCMNREKHLRQSVRMWVKLPSIDEILIVDWSTRESIDDLLDFDPRIRIVRAEGEPRWVQTYASNLGIAQARGDIILKCDADCMPTPAVMNLRPAAGRYYAGDWHSGAAAGKICVNGQCLFTRDQWQQVNGYSELIRHYAHDDTDFYDRMIACGQTRLEITPDLLTFLPHTDGDRVVNFQTGQASYDTVESFLYSQLPYHEAINKLIAGLIPWGPWFQRAAFAPVGGDGRLLRVKRDTSLEIPLSESLQQLARAQAIRAITARVCKIPPPVFARMDDAACLVQLGRLIKKTA